MMIYFRTLRAGVSHVDPCLPAMQACRDHDCVVELENRPWHVAPIQSYVYCVERPAACSLAAPCAVTDDEKAWT